MSTAIVLLGRHGDLINLLPVAKHLYDTTGEKPHWVVSRVYWTTLMGCNYVEPDPVHFSIHKVQHALEYSQSKYAITLNGTAWGKHWKGSRVNSFNYSSWDNVGYGKHFADFKGFPLVFDARDKDRESFLVERYCDSRPLILLSLACCKSSPFHHASNLQGIIRRKWGSSCNIVDLCDVKAARLYDLLGLFDRAAVLVTGDTAALHLATASPELPVVALVNDNPFLSTQPRCKLAFSSAYAQAIPNVSRIHAAIWEALQQAQRKKQTQTVPESSGELDSALEAT